MDDSLEEDGLIPDKGMHRIFETKELDYLTHIVLRMYENTAVSGTIFGFWIVCVVEVC